MTCCLLIRVDVAAVDTVIVSVVLRDTPEAARQQIALPQGIIHVGVHEVSRPSWGIANSTKRESIGRNRFTFARFRRGPERSRSFVRSRCNCCWQVWM